MLRAQVENQLTIYRPDAIGVLRDVADQQWLQDARIIPDQPSKGIKCAWARARRNKRGKWKDGVPPEPDYSSLDSSPWLHGPNQEVMDQMRALEDQEFVQDLDEEEAWNCRHPDAKYVVPDHTSQTTCWSRLSGSTVERARGAARSTNGPSQVGKRSSRPSTPSCAKPKAPATRRASCHGKPRRRARSS